MSENAQMGTEISSHPSIATINDNFMYYHDNFLLYLFNFHKIAYDKNVAQVLNMNNMDCICYKGASKSPIYGSPPCVNWLKYARFL